MGAQVRAFDVIDATAGTTSRARLRLTGEGVPASVFVKLAPSPLATRAFVDLMGLGATEVRFYADLARVVPIAVPDVYAVRADPATGRFALILEDLAARGCRFGDVRAAADVEQAFAVVRTLARLHAAFSDDPRFATDLAWVVTHAEDPNSRLVRPFVRAALRRVSRAHPDLVPPGAATLIAERDRLERALATDAPTLLHGDPHLGNLYFDATTPGFLDWQVVRKGHGLRDVAYFLVLSVDGDTRRANQEDYIGAYVEELASRGGARLTVDEAFLRYRREASYAWIAAVVTTGLGGLQAAAIAATGLRRAAAAVDDLETVAAVRDLLAPAVAGG